jgi:long-subunit fatty acid transport protein
MQHKNLFILLIIALFIISMESANCQVKKGQVGFRFLENPISAEAIGRGGLGLVAIRNANTVFWNPAGLGWMAGKLDFNINYTSGIADINNSSFAAAYMIGRFGFVALDFMIMDYGDFYGTRRANNEQGFVDTETFSPQSYAVGLSFSQRVSDRFSYGVRVKYARQDLGDAWITISGKDVDDPDLQITQKSYIHGEPAIDIGAIYDFLYHNIRFGAVIQNFSREIKYENEKFPMPFAVSFSLTVDPISFVVQDQKDYSFFVGMETRHSRDFKEKIKVGAEFEYKKVMILRTGYMGNYDERGLTLGIGFRREYFNSKFRFDYGYEEFGVFNGVHIFSFGVMY